MTVQRSAVVHISILAPPKSVIAFLSEMENWKTWAPWVHSVARISERDWNVETESGRLKFHFVEPNSMGVLDHEVTVPSGMTVFNSMRVVPNGAGSELVMVVFQSPVDSSEQLDRDVQAVTDDFARLKLAAEKFSKETAR